MRYDCETFLKDRKRAIKNGEVSQGITLGAFFAYLCEKGTITNLANINWMSFYSTLFTTEEDVDFIDELENHQLKLAVLDYWIQHRNIVLGQNMGMMGMEDDDRVEKWKTMFNSLKNIQKYDISAILQHESNLQKDVNILKRQVAEISKTHYLDIIITDGKTPEEIKETELSIKQTLPKGNPAIARKLKELFILGKIDILDIPDSSVLNSINTRFGTDIKYAAFHRAMDNVDARCRGKQGK